LSSEAPGKIRWAESASLWTWLEHKREKKRKNRQLGINYVERRRNARGNGRIGKQSGTSSNWGPFK
jgi:hypothetical protein